MAQAGSVQLFAQLLDGKTITLDGVDVQNGTGAMLFEKAAAKMDVPVGELRLQYRGKVLDADTSLSLLAGLGKEATVVVVARLRAGLGGLGGGGGAGAEEEEGAVPGDGASDASMAEGASDASMGGVYTQHAGGRVSCGNVTVERVTWREGVGVAGFAWDAYRRQNVRVIITGDASVTDLIRSVAVRADFAEGVCRVWLCARIPDGQTYSIVDHMIMRPAGFHPASEVDVSGMELLEAATAVEVFSFGRGLSNWTKRMSSDEYERLRGVEPQSSAAGSSVSHAASPDACWRLRDEDMLACLEQYEAQSGVTSLQRLAGTAVDAQLLQQAADLNPEGRELPTSWDHTIALVAAGQVPSPPCSPPGTPVSTPPGSPKAKVAEVVPQTVAATRMLPEGRSSPTTASLLCHEGAEALDERPPVPVALNGGVLTSSIVGHGATRVLHALTARLDIVLSPLRRVRVRLHGATRRAAPARAPPRAGIRKRPRRILQSEAPPCEPSPREQPSAEPLLRDSGAVLAVVQADVPPEATDSRLPFGAATGSCHLAVAPLATPLASMPSLWAGRATPSPLPFADAPLSLVGDEPFGGDVLASLVDDGAQGVLHLFVRGGTPATLSTVTIEVAAHGATADEAKDAVAAKNGGVRPLLLYWGIHVLEGALPADLPSGAELAATFRLLAGIGGAAGSSSGEASLAILCALCGTPLPPGYHSQTCGCERDWHLGKRRAPLLASPPRRALTELPPELLSNVLAQAVRALFPIDDVYALGRTCTALLALVRDLPLEHWRARWLRLAPGRPMPRDAAEVRSHLRAELAMTKLQRAQGASGEWLADAVAEGGIAPLGLPLEAAMLVAGAKVRHSEEPDLDGPLALRLQPPLRTDDFGQPPEPSVATHMRVTRAYGGFAVVPPHPKLEAEGYHVLAQCHLHGYVIALAVRNDRLLFTRTRLYSGFEVTAMQTSADRVLSHALEAGVDAEPATPYALARDDKLSTHPFGFLTLGTLSDRGTHPLSFDAVVGNVVPSLREPLHLSFVCDVRPIESEFYLAVPHAVLARHHLLEHATGAFKVGGVCYLLVGKGGQVFAWQHRPAFAFVHEYSKLQLAQGLPPLEVLPLRRVTLPATGSEDGDSHHGGSHHGGSDDGGSDHDGSTTDSEGDDAPDAHPHEQMAQHGLAHEPDYAQGRFDCSVHGGQCDADAYVCKHCDVTFCTVCNAFGCPGEQPSSSGGTHSSSQSYERHRANSFYDSSPTRSP